MGVVVSVEVWNRVGRFIARAAVLFIFKLCWARIMILFCFKYPFQTRVSIHHSTTINWQRWLAWHTWGSQYVYEWLETKNPLPLRVNLAEQHLPVRQPEKKRTFCLITSWNGFQMALRSSIWLGRTMSLWLQYYFSAFHQVNSKKANYKSPFNVFV